MGKVDLNSLPNIGNWYVRLQFGLYRDYRIIRMADAQGNMRDGIFIPFIQNGIRWDGVAKKWPVQYLKPTWLPGNGSRVYGLMPMVSQAFREKMVAAGVLSPDDKYPCDRVGYVYKDRDKM